MSLILEALRKSEAERRRGKVPDLHTEPSPGAQPRGDGPPAWLWLALLFATAMVVAMALWLIRSAPWGPSAAAEVPLVATNPVDAGAGREPQAQRPLERADAAIVTAEPVRRVDLAAIPGAPGSSDPAPAAVPLRFRETRDTPTASVLTASPSSTPSLPTGSSDATASAALAAPTPATPLPPVTLPTRSTVTAAAAPSATMAAATPSAATGEPRRLSDLAVDERRQLPPLKMSMHMWAPTQRFAIIDGSRVSEGDRIGDAVVEEITADGVVLAWQGQRLQLPTR